MAAIVLAHGIAQEQYSASLLEARWLPPLAAGVRLAGNPELADLLWHEQRPGAIDVRMAFYGDAFGAPGSQGGTTAGDVNLEQMALAEQLAAEWLRTAVERAEDPHDRQEAMRQLARLAAGTAGAQGLPAAARSAVDGLSRLRWFAPFGFGVAEKFVWRALSQVTGYLTDDAVREHAQRRVLELIEPDTRLVIGHSLGSVVAYEALHRTDQPTALLTLGSPLAVQSIVYPRLRPQPPSVPPALTRWDNVADRDDLVAAQLDLAPYFAPAAGQAVSPRTRGPVDNGAKPHDATRYLATRVVGTVVAECL